MPPSLANTGWCYVQEGVLDLGTQIVASWKFQFPPPPPQKLELLGSHNLDVLAELIYLEVCSSLLQ